MLNGLKEWPAAVRKFSHLHEYNRRVDKSASAERWGVNTPEYPNIAQARFVSVLKGLTHAGAHNMGVQYGKILYNIEILVFTVWWFTEVIIPYHIVLS